MSQYDYFTKLGRDLNLKEFQPLWFDDVVGGIQCAHVPNECLDDYLLDIRKKYYGITYLFKLPAKTFYTWHHDRKRLCAINYEITQDNSITYIGKPGYRNNYDNLEVVDYDNQMILIDTSKEHSIANLGGERIVFTLGINHVKYEDVKSYLNDK